MSFDDLGEGFSHVTTDSIVMPGFVPVEPGLCPACGSRKALACGLCDICLSESKGVLCISRSGG
jgi:hypothetical protein